MQNRVNSFLKGKKANKKKHCDTLQQKSLQQKYKLMEKGAKLMI